MHIVRVCELVNLYSCCRIPQLTALCVHEVYVMCCVKGVAIDDDSLKLGLDCVLLGQLIYGASVYGMGSGCVLSLARQTLSTTRGLD